MPRSTFALDAGVIMVMWASRADSVVEHISSEAKQNKSFQHLGRKDRLPGDHRPGSRTVVCQLGSGQRGVGVHSNSSSSGSNLSSHGVERGLEEVGSGFFVPNRILSVQTGPPSALSMEQLRQHQQHGDRDCWVPFDGGGEGQYCCLPQHRASGHGFVMCKPWPPRSL